MNKQQLTAQIETLKERKNVLIANCCDTTINQREIYRAEIRDIEAQINTLVTDRLNAEEEVTNAATQPERTYIVLGSEAPRYCYGGNFVRGFKGASPEDALNKAKATNGGNRYHSVIEYDKSGDYKVIFPQPREIGSDGIPF